MAWWRAAWLVGVTIATHPVFRRTWLAEGAFYPDLPLYRGALCVCVRWCDVVRRRVCCRVSWWCVFMLRMVLLLSSVGLFASSSWFVFLLVRGCKSRFFLVHGAGCMVQGAWCMAHVAGEA